MALTPITQTPVAETTPHLQKKEGKNTIAALDGVRAIAALLVISLHISEIAGVPWDVNQYPLATALAFFGRTGIVLFFVLSGFLLFLPYARALLFQDAWPSVRVFYLKRIFRIWPGYYLVLAVMILLFSRKYLQLDHWPQLGLFLTFFMDSSQQTWQQIDGPFWTLAVEWQFYLLLPWIAYAFSLVVRRLARFPRQRLMVVLLCCGAVIVLSLLVRGFGLAYQRHPGVNVLVPPAILHVVLFFIFGIQGKYLEVFALGMMLSTLFLFAQHTEYGSLLKTRLQRLSYWAWGSGILVLFFIALWQVEAETDRNAMPDFTAFVFFQPFRSFYAWLGEPIAGLGFTLCLFAILFGSPALTWLFERRWLGWIGMISYGLYMWHLNLLLAFNRWFSTFLADAGGTLGKDLILWGFLIVVLLPFCYLFYKMIEEPGIRLGAYLIRKRLGQPRPPLSVQRAPSP